MPTTDKISLTEEKETLFITLYAKALDNRSKHSILQDEKADDLCRRIDYNFAKHESLGNNVTVIRAKHFDEWIKEFISVNKEGVVVYLGCGMDTRISRLNPPSHIHWFDVDYPEVIQFRKTFYSNKENYRMIESSVNDLQWLEKIPADQPTLVIAEGLLEYLSQNEVKKLFNRLTDHFSHGQIIFDVMNSFAVEAGKKELEKTTGAIHRWAVDEIHEVEQLNPNLKRITALSLFTSPYVRKLPFGPRLLLGIMCIIPKYKNMIRLLRYQF